MQPPRVVFVPFDRQTTQIVKTARTLATTGVVMIKRAYLFLRNATEQIAV
jgi:hypothetical protein